MKRVMIVGQPGAGKSTIARQIGQRTGLPVVHIDKIHWMPGWVERPYEEKTRMCLEVHAQEKWVFEGGHSVTWADRFARCDTLVWIDVGVWQRMYRVLRRCYRDHGKVRVDMQDDCPEQFSWEFYQFIWKTRNSSRARIKRLFEKAPESKTCVHLRNQRDISDFLQSLSPQS